MQSDNKEIYRLTAEREGVPFQLYKDLGGFVFNKLYATLKRPPKLIIKVRGLGNWFLRRQRMKRILQYFNENFENAEKVGNTIVLTENREELYKILTERDKDYDRYVTLKHEIRKIRYETQTLLEPDQGKTTALRPAKLSLSNIKAVIQSWFRKKQMSIGGFPMANHIYEQIIWRRTRVQKISPQCWYLGNCKVCGCDILGKTMEDRGCSVSEHPELQKTMAPCYPAMMDEKEWEQYKINKDIKLFD